MRVRRIGDLFTIAKGKKYEDAQANAANEMVRYIQIEDLRNDNNIKMVNKIDNGVYVTSNDVLIAWDGANAGTVGYNLTGIIGSTLAVLRPLDSDNYIPYIAMFLRSKSSYLRDNCTGATIPHINKKVLEDIEVPLPSYDQQKEIAYLLDKAQTLINKRKQAIAKLDELVQAVFLDMFGDPVSNDKSWEQHIFNKFIQDIESGWSPVCKTTQANSDEWGVLKLSAITSGLYNASENKVITESTIPKPSLEVRAGDLLFVRKNTLDLVGTCAYVFETPSKLMLPDTIFRFVLREDSKMNKLFLWQLFNYPKYKKQIQKLAGGTAGSMPNISKSKLLNFEVIFPDPELQNKFSAIVHKIELQKRKQFHSLQQLESNFQALLQKAFKGELKVKDGVAV
ncbi:restriction endonuclease subunit S [Paenibacillus sp. J14]|uniref:restriction endonuclease subunit S n=1 Tax=Paenibacillus sp. (strain J14) TaxID=935845 RepID=UPI0004B7F328|nr:restriction endonuclease subunit S [Paenibacillus sp. J14]